MILLHVNMYALRIYAHAFSGPGISAEHQKKLFGNFVQIRPNQLQEGQGSGLGLSLCKQLVNLHGGTIGVTSIEGRGCSFHFTIPFKVYQSNSAHQPNSSLLSQPAIKYGNCVESMIHQNAGISIEMTQFNDSNIHNQSLSPIATLVNSHEEDDYHSFQIEQEEPLLPNIRSSNSNRMRVLIVDDDMFNLRMLKMLLMKYGLEVTCAENGQAAFLLVQQDILNFKMVLMDNLMPVMV
mmetsp:Transcript_1230/g.2031  ORF Transcript_1230/g.2031 Transcript_1230/m.2031 type:complete len:237 (+) Transcript_1230:1451-2161(+)